MLSNAKRRAFKKNLNFNLTLEDIVVPDLCPILKIPFIIGTKGNYEHTPSLDRINNNLGYIKNNVQIITKKANSMKNSATSEELLLFADWILKNYK
jgi:archaellum component FlaC